VSDTKRMNNDANFAPETTVTLNGVGYRIELESDPEDIDATPARQIGWIHGPRGATGMIVRTQPTGTYLIHANSKSTLGRLPLRMVHDTLSAHFS